MPACLSDGSGTEPQCRRQSTDKSLGWQPGDTAKGRNAIAPSPIDKTGSILEDPDDVISGAQHMAKSVGRKVGSFHCA